MSWLLYGFVRESSPAGPELPLGLRERTIERLTASGLSALVSEHNSPVHGEEEEALAFASVIDRIHREIDLLPARFPTQVADRESLLQVLQDGNDALLTGLERITGCCELGVRVLWPASVGQGPVAEQTHSDGRSYLAARQEQMQASAQQLADRDLRARELGDRLAALLGTAVRELRVDLPQPTATVSLSATGARTASIDLLVPRGEATRAFATLQDAMQGLAATYDCQLFPSGPWPPYSFAPSLA